MMMDMEQPTMTRDMTHMITSTTIRHRSKCVCVCVCLFCGVWAIFCPCKGHLSECMWSYIGTREFIHNVGQCSPLCIEPKSLYRSSQSWTWSFAALEIFQSNVGVQKREVSISLINHSFIWLFSLQGDIYCCMSGRAIAGVCGAPVQVVPVGPIWNSFMLVQFMYLCYLHNV